MSIYIYISNTSHIHILIIYSGIIIWGDGIVCIHNVNELHWPLLCVLMINWHTINTLITSLPLSFYNFICRMQNFTLLSTILLWALRCLSVRSHSLHSILCHSNHRTRTLYHQHLLNTFSGHQRELQMSLI